MQDEPRGYGYTVLTGILLVAFIVCIVMAFHGSRRYLAHRPQDDVIAVSPPKADEVPAVGTVDSGSTPTSPSEGRVASVPKPAPDLRQSVDLPEKPSHVEEAAPVAEAGPRNEDRAAEHRRPAHHHRRHAWRRPRLIHHRRHKRGNPAYCEPLCGFFEDTAEAAGLIP